MTTLMKSDSKSCLSTPLPAGTIDSHMHTIPSDLSNYPLAPSAEYTPTPHTAHDAMRYYTSTSGLNLLRPRMVLTQVSVFGTDNSALLDDLAKLNGHKPTAGREVADASANNLGDRSEVAARGVVVIDPDQISVSELEMLWSRGARGVRINLVSVSRSVTREELRGVLQGTIDKLALTRIQRDGSSRDSRDSKDSDGKDSSTSSTNISDNNVNDTHNIKDSNDSNTNDGQKKWVIELYIPFTLVETLQSIIPSLANTHQICFCLDHFAGLKFPSPSSTSDNNTIITSTAQSSIDPAPPTTQTPAFSALLSLLTTSHPQTYLKVSAPYRVDATYLSAPTATLRRLEPFALTLLRRASDRLVWASDWPHTRFEEVDTIPFVEALIEWCDVVAGDEGGDADAEKGAAVRTRSERLREKVFKTNAERLWDMSSSASAVI